MKKEALSCRYSDESGNRCAVTVKSAKYGWDVIVKKNGVVVEQLNRTGSMLTVMSETVGPRF